MNKKGNKDQLWVLDMIGDELKGNILVTCYKSPIIHHKSPIILGFLEGYS